MNIIVSSAATEAERYAARELRSSLKAMTGENLAIRAAEATVSGVKLIIGESSLPPEAGPRLRALKEDEIEVRRLDSERVLFRGGGPRGTLYAVYEWLDSLGCRWYSPELTVIPRQTQIPLPNLIRTAPDFEFRDALWWTVSEHPDWACRNRYNGRLFRSRPPTSRHGGGVSIDPPSHTFFTAIPPDKHWASHPEYYSHRHGQGRVAAGAQLCLSNPDVLDIFVQFVLEHMAKPDVRMVAVSPNDCANPCQCPECEAKDRKAGNYSGSYIDFINRVAEATSKVHPDKYVVAVAYTYTVEPPRGISLHKNAILRIAHMEPSCDAHPLETCERNRRYVERLRGWRRISPRVFVWHYVTNFHHSMLFHPNFDALARDIRFYRDEGVSGIIFQGYHYKGWSFTELHSYVQARLAWDADRDYWQEAAEFANAYYGAGGKAVMEMINILQENVRKGFHSTLYTHPHEGLFRSEQLAKARELLKQAQRAVDGDATLEKRTAFLKLWLNYTTMAGCKPPRKVRDGFHIEAAPSAPKLFDSVRKAMVELGVNRLQESPPLVRKDLGLKFGWNLHTRTLPTPALENEQVKIEVCPELAGMVCTLFDKATGRDLFCKPQPWMIRYPYIGGYTEGKAGGGFKHGFENAYRLERSADKGSITLRATIEDGVSIERRIFLDKAAAAFWVDSAYTNHGRSSVRLSPHSFTIISLGEMKDIRMFAGRAEGRVADLQNAFPEGRGLASAQWVSLRDKTAPVGMWGAFNSKLGLGLAEEFGRYRPVYCGSNVYARDQRVLMEAMLAPRMLRPGAVRHFRHCLRIIHEYP